MTIRVGSLPAAPIAVLLLGCACARVNVETSKRRGYEKKLDRTIVAFIGMERFGDSYQQMLHERTIAEFAKRGVAVAFATFDRLSLDETPSFDAQAKEFRASTALIVYRTEGTIDSLSGQIVNAEFDAQLFDLALQKRVWRAAIRYGSGGGFTTDSQRVDKLVGGIADALAADGLLAAAPAAQGRKPVAAAWISARRPLAPQASGQAKGNAAVALPNR